eukprot:scaffold8162_cov101-Isochrysis_galbana.AAC.1
MCPSPVGLSAPKVAGWEGGTACRTIVNLTSVKKQFVQVASSAHSLGLPALGLAVAADPPVLARGTSSRSASSSASHCAASSRASSASSLAPDTADAGAGRGRD